MIEWVEGGRGGVCISGVCGDLSVHSRGIRRANDWRFGVVTIPSMVMVP